jgi:hypothetical protein
MTSEYGFIKFATMRRYQKVIECVLHNDVCSRLNSDRRSSLRQNLPLDPTFALGMGGVRQTWEVAQRESKGQELHPVNEQ